MCTEGEKVIREEKDRYRCYANMAYNVNGGTHLAGFRAGLTRALKAYGTKQELFTKQSPQKHKVLREHALIESAISSNRIEGVEVVGSHCGTDASGDRQCDRRHECRRGGGSDCLAGHVSFPSAATSVAAIAPTPTRRREVTRSS